MSTVAQLAQPAFAAKSSSSVASRQACSIVAPRLAAVRRSAFTAAGSSKAARSSSVVKAAAAAGEAAAAAQQCTYETMLVLRPTMADEERDQELAKFQAFLQKQGASQLSDMVRGRQRLAYPIKRFTEGIYVLYTYTAGPAAGQAVQKYLSTPQAGSELNILRHMTFRL